MNTGIQKRNHRRHLTILFADMCGSTRISALIEPEEFSALLESLRRVFTDIVHKYGGVLVRVDGDGFLFAFGYPVLYEDASRRAIEAALDLHAAIERFNTERTAFNFPLQFHTGIHAGTVLLQEGDTSRGLFEILGQPVNIAAHICDMAQPGQIVISDTTLGADRLLFDVSDLISVPLKKGQSPVLARAIIKRRKMDPFLPASWLRSQFSTTPFAGRDSELTAMWRALRTESPVIFLLGEAGMGKSRLLYKLQKQAELSGHGSYLASCSAGPDASILQPILQLLDMMQKRLIQLLEMPACENRDDVAQLISEIEPVIRVDMKSTHETQIDHISSLILRINTIQTGNKSQLIVIDDWHWADKASLAVVEKLAHSDHQKLKIILSTRQWDGLFADRVSASFVTLSPLTQADLEFAAKHLSPQIDPFTLKQLQSLSGGNPLFLEELCYAYNRDGGQLRAGNQNVWLQSLICDRFASLEPALAEILKAAAIIGDTVPLELLEDILPSKPAPSQFLSLQKLDFLFPENTTGHVRFKHGLTRDAIYDIIPLDERRALHAHAANHFQQLKYGTDSLVYNAQLSYHYGRSEQYEAAIHHAIEAGETALQASSLDIAQFHFEAAFTYLEKQNVHDARGLDIIHNFGLASIVDPNSEHIEVLNRAVAWCSRFQDIPGLAWSYCWLTSLYYGLGEPEQAKHSLAKTRQVAHTLKDDRLNTQIDAREAQILIATADYETGYDLLDTAIAIKQSNRSGDRPSPSLAYALSCKAFALADQGHFETSHILFEQAFGYLNNAPNETAMSIMGHLSAAALWNQTFDIAREHARQALKMAEQMRSRYHHAVSKALMAAASFQMTDDPDFLKQIETATRWMRSGGSQQYISLAYAYLIEGYTHLQDWLKVRQFSAQALSRSRQGDRLGECVAYRSLALAARHGHARHASHIYIDKADAGAQRRMSKRELALNASLRKQLSL